MPNFIEREYFMVRCQASDEGDLIIPFPQLILDYLRWKEGDLLEVSIEEGKLVIAKVL